MFVVLVICIFCIFAFSSIYAIDINNVEGFFKKLVVSDFIFSWYGKPDFISFDVYNHDQENLTKLKEKGYKII